jgi:hypothetical protein
MDLKPVMSIIGSMPNKHQKAVLSFAKFDGRPTKDIWHDIIDATIANCKNAQKREILGIYRQMPIPDDIIEQTFGGMGDFAEPLFLSEDQLSWVKDNVYRNREGKFRIIPAAACTLDDMPLDGLEADEKIIESKLFCSRRTEVGGVETMDGLMELTQQHYEPPYDGVYKSLAPNLQRINIISSFAKDDPSGFFKREDKIYRNLAHQITKVDPAQVSELSLRRALLLMYLVAGGTEETWRTLYALVHYMVKYPNSPVGYIVYLNDFDAGGNGKSKFVNILQGMFGDAFTAFEPHQLRFNISLMGKRLVHISEFEDNETSKHLLGMLKSMTGRDRFQYEGKGMDPIVSDTYQNFIISSNKYIYFDDAGIKRRLQNFHCSNLLHLLLNKYYKSSEFLNKFLGNVFNGEATLFSRQMSHSLLDYILKDDKEYNILLRPQNVVIGNFSNPVLRGLFRGNFNADACIRTMDAGSVLDFERIIPEARPEQYNYAAGTLANWLYPLPTIVGRDGLQLHSELPEKEFAAAIMNKIKELDVKSLKLKRKQLVELESAELNGIQAFDLLDEFIDMSDVNFFLDNQVLRVQ